MSLIKVYLFLVYYYGSGYIALKGRMTEEEWKDMMKEWVMV
jgi:hypothetical protein